MSPPTQPMDFLSSLVDALARRGDPHLALAYASLTITRKDTSLYANMLNQPGMEEKTIKEIAAKIKAAKGAERLNLIRENPAAMLLWLDELAKTPWEEAAHPFPESVYSGDVFRFDIEKKVANSLGFPNCWKTIYLAPQTYSGCHSRVAQQGLSPYRYTPNWYVMPDAPDQNQGNRKIEIVDITKRFRSECHAILQRGNMRIYLAEFQTIPKFESRLAGADNNYWSTTGLQNEQMISDEAMLHLRQADRLKADVLVFPELTISPRIRDRIAEQLSVSGEDGAVSLVIAGSFHETAGQSRQKKNVTYALDRFGNHVMAGIGTRAKPWRHEKQNPVKIAAADGRLELQEDLDSGNLVTLLHTPLGLQSIVNCLDLAQAAAISTMRLELMPQRILWVPSMSEGVSAHLAHAKNLQLNHGTIVACANQADAQFTAHHGIRNKPENKKRQSFVYAAQDDVISEEKWHDAGYVVDVRLNGRLPETKK